MFSRRAFLKISAAAGIGLLAGLRPGVQSLQAAGSRQQVYFPSISLEFSDQPVIVYDSQGQLIGPARCAIDGRSNKIGRCTGSFNMQYLQLQQEMNFEFLDALVVESTLPALAQFSGRGWSIRGRERNKCSFTAEMTRSAVNPGFLDIAFTGDGIFVDNDGPPQQADWRFSAGGSIIIV